MNTVTRNQCKTLLKSRQRANKNIKPHVQIPNPIRFITQSQSTNEFLVALTATIIEYNSAATSIVQGYRLVRPSNKERPAITIPKTAKAIVKVDGVIAALLKAVKVPKPL